MKTVLLVDDEADICKMLKDDLDARYSVKIAHDSRTALKILEKNKVDIVVSDIKMPGEDGLWLLTEAIKFYQVPFVMMTGHGDDLTAQKVIDLGAKDFICKPFDIAELFASISQILGNPLSKRTEVSNIHPNHQLVTVGLMTAAIIHEIRNFITSIKGNADLIIDLDKKNKLTNSHSVNHSKRIQAATDKMTSMLESMLRMSRNEQQAFTENDVDTIINDVVLVSSAKVKSTAAKLYVTDFKSSKIVCNRQSICQILVNLIINACDAIHKIPERWISLDVIPDENTLKISVTNSGEKISEDLQEKIFEPLFTTKSEGHGTGIGLSVVQQMVENHKGKIYIDPVYPQTRFVVELPIDLSMTNEQVA